MKRGRPNKRGEIKNAIVEILGKSSVPMTTSALNRIVNETLNTKVSWNTVQKYVLEMVEANNIKPISLQHSKKKGETGLVVYMLKD